MKKVPKRISRRKSEEHPREATLRLLKLNREMAVSELCKALKLTPTAVRRKLAVLQRDGLVTSHASQVGKGRPTLKYELTQKAASAFPSAYESLANNLLDTVFQQHGHAGVMEFLKSGNDRIITQLEPQFTALDIKQRLAAIAKYFADNGYMTDWIPMPDGKFFLYHQNCAVHALAERYRQFCIVEPRLIERLLGLKIARTQYILKGQPICGYEIDPNRKLTVGDQFP